MIQFGGMDGSAVIQAAWRYHLGQEPYRDFLTPAPPSYLIIPGLAFKFLGVAWTSLVRIAAVASAAAFVGQYYLLRRVGWPCLWCFAVSLCTQTVTMLPIGWWTYNQTTAVFASLYTTAAMAFLSGPRDRVARVALGISMLLLSWGKPNVAGLLLSGSAVIFLSSKATRNPFIIVSVVSAAISVGLLVGLNVDPRRLVESYLGSGGRLGNKGMFLQCFIFNDYWESMVTVPLLITMLLAVGLAWRRASLWIATIPKQLPWLLFLMIVTSLAAMATNNELNMVDAPLFFLATAGFVLANRPRIYWRIRSDLFSNSSLARIMTLGSIAALFCFGMRISIHRQRIMSIGWLTFWQPGALQSIEAPPFFRGMEVGRRFQSVLAELQIVLRKSNISNLDRHEVFFGPRMEFAYAAFDFVPPPGLFLWWPGTGEASPEQIDTVVARFQLWRPKLCVFLKNDYTYMPKVLCDFLSDHYTVTHFGELTLFYRRNGNVSGHPETSPRPSRFP